MRVSLWVLRTRIKPLTLGKLLSDLPTCNNSHANGGQAVSSQFDEFSTQGDAVGLFPHLGF